jgi:MYXO-CTERM domain-containing protein
MRAVVRSAVLSVVAATAFATPALADTANGICDAKSLDCSRGATNLHAESREPVMSTIGTGWLPACATPDPNGHCGSDQPIQVSVSMDLAALPAPSKEPLWLVDMARTAVVEARWPSTKAFDLALPTSKVMDGTFKVSHTLIPAVRVYATLFGLTKEWMYDASRFLTEYAANFNYAATNTVQFLPWGFDTPVKNIVPAPNLTTTSLLNVKLINDGNNNVDLGLAASTTPTFTYRTTKVTLAGTTAPITQATKNSELAMLDADFLELQADVEGEILVAGELIAAPYVAINKIGGISVPGGIGVLDLSGPLNAPKKAYTSTPAVAVKFPQVKIRIPLPNVKAPKSVDLGAAQVGSNVEKPATIKNTGELGAKMSFASSDPQFVVVTGAETDKKTDYALAIRFTPAQEGPQSATIVVTSNDPDQPSQTITVTGNGTAVPVVAPPAAPAPEDEFTPRTESGCGCRTTAPVSSSEAALGGLAVLGALLLRRRRSNAS